MNLFNYKLQKFKIRGFNRFVIFQIDAKCINEHDLKIICQCRNNNGRYVVICKKLESYLEIIEPLASKASNVVDIFLLTFNKITKVSNNFISITEQETEKYDIMLWKKKVGTQRSILYTLCVILKTNFTVLNFIRFKKFPTRNYSSSYLYDSHPAPERSFPTYFYIIMCSLLTL